MRYRLNTLTAVGLFLSSCGGDDPSSTPAPVVTPSPTPIPAPTPTPVPTPTPTPVPTPTPAPTPTNATLTDLRYDQQFVTPYGTMLFGRNDASQTGVEHVGAGSQDATFKYFAGSKTYRVYSPTYDPAWTEPITYEDFGEAQRVAAESTPAFSFYSVPGTRFPSYSLRLLNPGPTNPLIALTYASIGIYDRRTLPAKPPLLWPDTVWAFSYGITTPVGAALPGSDTTYQGIVTGIGLRDSYKNGVPVYAIDGQVSLVVNFANGTLSGTITLTGVNDLTGATENLGTFTIRKDGRVSEMSAPGRFVSGGGQIAYAAYGPAGEELAGGLGFRLKDVDSSQPDFGLTLAFATKR
ncbi:hypothetical protein ABIC65_003541 [Sphingomonas trueperi]|uniref:hypothetical protein n=1 Tax=Sphingomonas trueperi TaxID=53317 RepID=UPI0033976EFF